VLVTRAVFNRQTGADGVGVMTLDPLSLRERLLGRDPERRLVRVRRDDERHHFVLVGDPGMGTASIVRQLLRQIRSRGETAIVYDRTQEFTAEFYDPARGDRLLNPLDQRMPYWTPGDEVTHGAEALSLATSLVPAAPTESAPIIVGSARRILAHLLRYRPSPQELARWLRQREEIVRRLAGADLAHALDRQTPGQRTSVADLFTLLADAFEFLPAEGEVVGRWSTAAWAPARTGWLFFPILPEAEAPLRPLVSGWLDTLLLRLMSPPEGDHQPVWIVLDELARLQRLP
jgi:hypothetical protein